MDEVPGIVLGAFHTGDRAGVRNDGLGLDLLDVA
jgi:hypothetical protein